MLIYDTIIIGTGPAGLTAGIYATRRAMKTLIIGAEVGGQMGKTFTIENYPGIKTVGGLDLAFSMKEQVKELGAEVLVGQVEKITKENNLFVVEEKTSGQKYTSKTIILSFGLKKRRLGLTEEEKFDGHGVSYCINCDGPLFKNKIVAVVGGGNSGAEAAEFMAKICPQVYWLELTKELRADAITVDRIKQLNNVKILMETKITTILGQEKVAGVEIETAGQKENITLDGVFVEIGYLAKTEWLNGLVDLDSMGQIQVDSLQRTKTLGLFAAGDVTNSKYKQVIVAAGTGAMAALEAYDYIQKNKF